MVDVRLLGPVELWRGGVQVPLGPRQRRCILAALALTPGRPVTAEALVDRMWDGALPRDPRNVLYTNISRLRSDLARAGVAVQRGENGYVLELAAENIDVHRMRQLAARARSLVAEHPGNTGEAVELFRSASTLWRDLPLTDLRGEWAERVRYGLRQERIAMDSQRFELELMIGQHADAVGPLADLVAEYPLDESLAGLLMLALYRCGRQVDALGVFMRLRRRVVDEIGDEPGTQLKDLHDKILRRDATLEWPDLCGVTLHREMSGPDSGTTPLDLTSRPAQLPPDVNGFVGRAAALATLDELVPGKDAASTAVIIAVLDGAAGVGKTALAVHWAHRVRNQFPDGQLYADLRGYASDAPLEPLEVLSQFLRALGIPTETVPGELREASAMYRSVLADRRVLVLLDNAATAEQVRPLVAGGAGSMVLVTSRDHLAGLVARDGARRVRLGMLPRSEAVSLLIALLGPERQQAEPVSIGELAEFCADLPLALRVAAANLVARPECSISDYLAEALRSDRLAVLAVPDDPQCAVAEALDLSYVRLPESARRMFRLFGLLPCVEVDAEVAARLADTDVGAAARTLGILANAHLIEERASGRFKCHDLLRDYATIRAAQEERSPECEAARKRYLDYYVEMTDAVAELAFPQAVRVRHRESDLGPLGGGRFKNAAEATAWLDVERATVVAAVQHAADTGHYKHAWELADNLRGYFWLHMHTAEWMAAARAGVAAAEAAGDLRGQAAGELSLASLSWRTGQYSDVVRHGSVALGLARRARWVRGQAAVLGNMGLASARLGDVELGASQLRKAQILSRHSGWRYGEASALGNLGMMLTHAGQLAEAAEAARRALAMTEELATSNGQAINLLTLGIVDWVAGRYGPAGDKFDRAHALYADVQSSSGLCTARYWLALLHGVCGRFEQASELAESTVVLARTKSHRDFVVHGLNVLADVQLRRAQHATAIETYRTATDLARQLDERSGALAEAHIGMAAAYLAADDLEQALRLVQRGLVVTECAGLRLMEAQASTVLAQVHLARGDVALALQVGTRALELHDSIGYRLGQVRIHQLLGDAWWRQGDVDRSIGHWRRAHGRPGSSEATESPAPPVSYECARAEAANNANQGTRTVLDAPSVRVIRPHEQGRCPGARG